MALPTRTHNPFLLGERPNLSFDPGQPLCNGGRCNQMPRSVHEQMMAWQTYESTHLTVLINSEWPNKYNNKQYPILSQNKI